MVAAHGRDGGRWSSVVPPPSPPGPGRGYYVPDGRYVWDARDEADDFVVWREQRVPVDAPVRATALVLAWWADRYRAQEPAPTPAGVWVSADSRFLRPVEG